MGQSNLPLANCQAHIAAFGRDGWVLARIKGSHHILAKEGREATLSVPCHGKELKRGTLATLIKSAGLTEDQYCDLFYKRKARYTQG